MVREILTDAQWERVQQERPARLLPLHPDGRPLPRQRLHRPEGDERRLPRDPGAAADDRRDRAAAAAREIADYHQGLVIVCGPSGSGKSTTLAALVNLFNETRHDHVITMEDPVEFVHPFKNCLINQREVGRDTKSFARALRAALREDPDVVVIGELRDTESVALALTAAETGHIVLGTLNSTSAHKAVDRILASFPADEQGQVRAALSESLKFVIAQRLLPSKEPRKQVAAFEVLRNTVAVANMIREEKTFQIPSAMQIGKSQGMQTFDDALKTLVTAEAQRRDRVPRGFQEGGLRGVPARRRPAASLPAHPSRGSHEQRELRVCTQDRPLPAPDDEPRRLRLPHDRGAPADAARVGIDGADPLSHAVGGRLHRADAADLPERLWEEFVATATSTSRTRSPGSRASASTCSASSAARAPSSA
jgi:energy-coupling factor transporter ATP-binding protein EcfA2